MDVGLSLDLVTGSGLSGILKDSGVVGFTPAVPGASSAQRETGSNASPCKMSTVSGVSVAECCIVEIASPSPDPVTLETVTPESNPVDVEVDLDEEVAVEVDTLMKVRALPQLEKEPVVGAPIASLQPQQQSYIDVEIGDEWEDFFDCEEELNLEASLTMSEKLQTSTRLIELCNSTLS